MSKPVRRDNSSTTSMRLDNSIFRDFRTVCLTQGKNASKVAEELFKKYTRDHAESASEHLKNVAKRIKDA